MYEPGTHSLRAKAPSETITPGRSKPTGWLASVGRCTGQVLGWERSDGRYGAGAARVTTTVESSGAATPKVSGGFFPATMSSVLAMTSAYCAYPEAVAGSTRRRRPATKSA